MLEMFRELVVSLIPLVIFVAAALWWSKHHREAQARAWGEVATRLGLRLVNPESPSMSIQGSIDDMPVQVHKEVEGAGKSRRVYTAVRVTLGYPFPQDLHVRQEGMLDKVAALVTESDIRVGDPTLDSSLRIRGKDPATVLESLSTGSLRGLLTMIHRHDQGCRAKDGEIVLRDQGLLMQLRLERLITDAVELGEAWRQDLRRPWDELARRTGLGHRVDGSRILLEGEIDEITVTVEVDTQPSRETPVRIRVSLPLGLPGGLGLRARPTGREDGAGIGLNDPILDPLLAATARDPDLARRWIHGSSAEDDLHGRLLAVLHAWPRSTLSEHTLLLNSDQASPTAVGQQLDACLDLGRALVRATRRLGLPA